MAWSLYSGSVIIHFICNYHHNYYHSFNIANQEQMYYYSSTILDYFRSRIIIYPTWFMCIQTFSYHSSLIDRHFVKIQLQYFYYSFPQRSTKINRENGLRLHGTASWQKPAIYVHVHVGTELWSSRCMDGTTEACYLYTCALAIAFQLQQHRSFEAVRWK
jgi:hypothetical protein